MWACLRHCSRLGCCCSGWDTAVAGRTCGHSRPAGCSSAFGPRGCSVWHGAGAGETGHGIASGHYRGWDSASQTAPGSDLWPGVHDDHQSLRNLQTQSLGMDTQNVVTAELTLGQQKYPQPVQRLAFFEELERRLQQLPGVAASGLSDSLPPSTPARTMPFIALQAQGRPALAPEQGIGGVVGWRSITPNYFSVLGIPLLQGRSFEEADRGPGTNAIVLNQALAQKLFPGEAALGKTIAFRLSDQAFSAKFTVVGVTGNTRNQGLGGPTGPEYYMVRKHAPDDLIFRFPDSQRISIVVRSAMDPETVARELRDVVAPIDRTLPVETSTLRQTVSTLAARPRFSAALLTLFAGIGLLLAAAGIYGLVSMLVNQRTQEIAIHVALGAAPSRVTQMMVTQMSVWIVLGAGAGISCSLIAARWVRSLLFGIKANDPSTLAAAVAVLMAVALVATYVPARRAAGSIPWWHCDTSRVREL
jgi:predicted permease